MKILIGTKNPGKIEGAKRAFEKFFDNVEVVGVSVSSDVPEQPVNKEIYMGAKNRVDNLIRYASAEELDADYFVAIESGITEELGKWSIVNMAVIKDKYGYESWGNSAGFPVPDRLVDDIISRSLGEVIDEIFEKNDLRSSIGGISYLTHGVMDRIALTEMAFVMALTQFVNGDIWRD
ncbi:MAG: inosine/xanthosine triphosphatase [Clostridiales bacterium]|nr:inosine/xanthosine triphosphatase [Clostridiales bacterium]